MEENKNQKSESARREEKVLEFWEQNQIFQKSMQSREGEKEFVFYEGPPTANGKPGIHHLEARAFKDVIPRYKTMRGFHVRRKGGWDTHGLPVELQVEKKLGLNSKKAIEEYGIAKFNSECKKSVWEYLEFWNTFTKRIGYWVDQENPYVTYENNYIESVWNVVGKINEQKLIYKDYKVVPWCPRCGTTLSSHELAQGYEDVKDLSLYVKFRVVSSSDTFPEVLGSSSPQPDIQEKHTVEETFILAWTTTPWTLPGNVALAVGESIDYIKVKLNNEFLILAEARISLLGEGFEVIKKFKGSELLGLKYEPLFPYLETTISESEKSKLEKAFKVYGADFVTTEDGTGVVHTAVMYGADDFTLGTEIGLPKHHLVNLEGKFISGTDFLSGRFVKEKDEAGKPTLDVDIIKYLQEKNLFFHKELYEHSYPHCWRCKTALIYYARDSWYIRMSDPVIKERMIQENKDINWEPEHNREGRFGEWLAGIKDWAISRERYWGTPLPIWVSEDGDKIVVESIDTLKKFVKKSGNKYFIMRHGESMGNKTDKVSFKNQIDDHLTEDGKNQAKLNAETLKEKNIDVIISSTFTRTKETAIIVADVLGIPKENIIEDSRLIEVNPGSFDGGSWQDYHNHIKTTGPNWFDRKIENGESLKDVKRRVGEVLYELEEKHKGKNILIITHGAPAWLSFVNTGLFEPDHKEYVPANTHIFVKEFIRFKNAEWRELPFAPIPHNENFELDLHRPYIDEVVLEREGKGYKRIKDVMDVWFDSGAMPFAQDHYPFDYAQGKPFENKELLYPADYISEAIDQTRGWFYTLHAVGTLMGRGKAYKNVICLGHLLDAKGKKMSKSQGNIVEPFSMIEKYGVDTLRLWMYSVNQPGESKNFDEKTVAILHSQVFGLLYNVLAFYELYRDRDLEKNEFVQSSNILDQWILAKLSGLIELSTSELDNYKVLEPARALRDFIGDLSTWYLRRNRDRIKDGDKDAKQTLYFVLKNLVKLMAPFTPFASEDIWLKLKNDTDIESVHLVDWPFDFAQDKPSDEVIEKMKEVRDLVSLGLQMRQKNNIPVRQPLSSFTITNKDFSDEYLEIIKDELNIKEIIFGDEIDINFGITEELKEEGLYREFLRSVQDSRKKEGLIPSDMITLFIETGDTGENIVKKFEDDFKKVAGIREIYFAQNEGVEVKVGELVFKIKIQK